VADLIISDKNKFETQMQQYNTYIKELKIKEGEDEDEEQAETVTSPQKFTFLTDDLKILSYKQVKSNNIVEVKGNDDEVEIKKLMKYTKTARIMNKNPDIQRASILSLFTPLLPLAASSRRGSLLSQIPTSYKMLDKTPLPKGHTTGIVKNEIMNAMFISEIINDKKKNLEECLKEHDLPSMEDYDRILMRNLTTKKIAQHTSVAPTKKEEKKEETGKKEFPALLKDKYEKKQIQWKIEEVQEGNLEKLEKEKKKETKSFLNQIRRRPRAPQQFIDQYSVREQKTNQNIVEINKILGKQHYDKKKLNKKIDEFISELEEKEHQEKIKKKREEKIIIPPSDQVKKYIKSNLDKEPD